MQQQLHLTCLHWSGVCMFTFFHSFLDLFGSAQLLQSWNLKSSVWYLLCLNEEIILNITFVIIIYVFSACYYLRRSLWWLVTLCDLFVLIIARIYLLFELQNFLWSLKFTQFAVFRLTSECFFDFIIKTTTLHVPVKDDVNARIYHIWIQIERGK